MDEVMSSIEEREELATLTENEEDVEFFEKYSEPWVIVRNAVLVKLANDQSFFNRVIGEFADHNLANSDFGKKMMKSFKDGIAVYGRLNKKTPPEPKADGTPRKSQFEIAMGILRDHPSILVANYAADVGININQPYGENGNVLNEG